MDRLKAKLAANQKLSSPEPTKSNLEAKTKLAGTDRGKRINRPDIYRIIDLPVVQPLSPDELEQFNKDHLLAPAYNSGFRLFSTQANGLFQYKKYGGLFGTIGVGWGKTLLSLMIADHAYVKGHHKMILMVPPEVVGQLMETDIKFIRTKVPVRCPIHCLAGRNINTRRSLCSSGRKGLYIMPYSLLSTKDTEENILNINPTIIIGDEAHQIANRRAARTRRIMSFIEDTNPECVFISGTVTNKGVRDYHHLARAALKDNSFLPNQVSTAHEWGQVIDAESVNWQDEPSGVSRSGGTGALVPLTGWAKRTFPSEDIAEDTEGFRKSYRLRMSHCPGVAASGDAEIGTSLLFSNQPVENYDSCEGFADLREHMDRVENEWLTPNGDEIEHAIHTWKWLFELSSGFYNQLTWPEPSALAERKQISSSEAADIIARSQDYHRAGQTYSSELRSWIGSYAKPGLDTPLLIGHDISTHGPKNVGTNLAHLWEAWKEKDFPQRIDRDSSAVRVSPFKINAAIKWAQETKTGGIIWYHHQEIGKWLTEAMNKASIPVVYCPAGEAGNTAILDKSNVNKFMVASITAHGTGKNLQHFQDQCFVQWPRSAKTCEQVLGRLHRNGQKADELVVRTFNTLLFDQMNFAAAINDSLYIHQSTGSRQKLIYGNYSPLPKIFPAAVLKERGAEGVKALNDEQQRMMDEKFG